MFWEGEGCVLLGVAVLTCWLPGFYAKLRNTALYGIAHSSENFYAFLTNLKSQDVVRFFCFSDDNLDFLEDNRDNSDNEKNGRNGICHEVTYN